MTIASFSSLRGFTKFHANKLFKYFSVDCECIAKGAWVPRRKGTGKKNEAMGVASAVHTDWQYTTSKF